MADRLRQNDHREMACEVIVMAIAWYAGTHVSQDVACRHLPSENKFALILVGEDRHRMPMVW